MKRSDGRVVAFALAIALLLTFSACAAAKQTAAGDFEPASPGHLTVATDLPAPAFWSGDDPKRVDGGFEWGIAHDLADAFDLDLTVVDVPFGDIIAGKLHGADLALAQVSITKRTREGSRLLDAVLHVATHGRRPQGAGISPTSRPRASGRGRRASRPPRPTSSTTSSARTTTRSSPAPSRRRWMRCGRAGSTPRSSTCRPRSS